MTPQITEAFKHEDFIVHRIETDKAEVYHRLAVPSRVAVILHDPINDKLFLNNKRDLTTFGTALVIPEFTPSMGESSYVTINQRLSALGTDAKSVGYVSTIAVDPRNSGKQVTLMYVQVDSRTIPSGVFEESTGTDLVKSLSSHDAVNAINIIAGNYLRMVRKRNGKASDKTSN